MSTQTTTYAGVISRGIAFLVDATTAALMATVGFQITVAVLSTFRVTDASFVGSGKAAGLAVSLPLVFAAYCAGWWTLMGRTPGMMLFGVRVVKRDGTAPGLWRSAVRAVGYWISSILMLGFIWVAIDRRHQGFHDKLAGTFVVYDWPVRQPVDPVRVA
jgi:uncharacterized RDD family membrane protein YckC